MSLKEGRRGWAETPGTFPALFEVRNAKPAIFNGWPGSSVESRKAAVLLDSVPCNTARGHAKW